MATWLENRLARVERMRLDGIYGRIRRDRLRGVMTPGNVGVMTPERITITRSEVVGTRLYYKSTCTCGDECEDTYGRLEEYADAHAAKHTPPAEIVDTWAPECMS